jgi:glycosyltransferase involved in cell wall biosynthesis
MKISVIAPTEIPARRANTLQVMKMTQALVAIGQTVCLLAPQTPGGPAARGAADWTELARHYGLQRAFPIEWLPAAPRLRRYDYSLRAVRWARRWKADLIYTRLPQAAALASQMGVPTVFELHDLPQGRLGPQIVRWFLGGRGAFCLVAITQALAADLGTRFGLPAGHLRILVAPDGVDLERYAGLPAPPLARQELARGLSAERGAVLRPERFTAGYTGHLYAGRGVEVLLAVAAQLPEMNFLIVGGEPQDVERVRRSAQTGHLENVWVTGFVPNADLPRYQAACDVLLMPYQRQVAASSGGDISRYLSPMKLFEYLACERPIVSSDLLVLREVLHSENAILLPGEDVGAWVAALRRLEAEPGLRSRLSARAREDAQQYSWEARAGKILSLQMGAGGKIEV